MRGSGLKKRRPCVISELAAFGLGVALLLPLLLVALLWARQEFDASYPMPPQAFHAQAKNITPGMSLDDVRSRLRGVTNETRLSSGGHAFVMQAQREPVIGIAINQYISLELDSQGRVVSVSTSDG